MVITGENLKRVHRGLGEYQAFIENQIVTCPDPKHYAGELALYTAEQKVLERLRARVQRAIAKEQAKCS